MQYPTQPDPKYRVVTASANHAARGLVVGNVQANDGKGTALHRMKPGDGVVICSPRTTFPCGLINGRVKVRQSAA